ncbi:sigma-70 family RNA polymerase sigma factor [Agilicoccus flavus]|uniref:sigma-70 family RNA polymerase sigma factor n=1 Tax=Agilicoccus flavus TaxID=2775968 RepID=UPI001CF63D95|nr:sigma-70 family RNA polymerase sigma factor [Agilicoccus flavus]
MVSPASGTDDLVAAFEEQRGRLEGVAVRMLGSRADAQDALQEAWLRLSRQDPDGIDNLAGWLTTVVGRVCIDVLRSRRSRSATPFDELPELVVVEGEAQAPEDEAVLAESVGLAMLVVLQTLTPAERLAFVLHDVFAVPFAEIGQILGRSSDATKMLASRARSKVRGTEPPGHGRAERAVVTAFLAAAREGDFEGLLAVLDPDVTLRIDTPRGSSVRLGATEVATVAERGARGGAMGRPAIVDGVPGVVFRSKDGRAFGVMGCTVVDGRIVAIVSVNDRARVLAAGVRDRPPAR